jgi:elongator complex protein 1
LSSVGISPDDDLLTRISWRGDGALFVVSAVSPLAGATLRRRVLRVYNRDGVLQTSGEPVPGLEHPLSWRPSGNLIVGAQRFGTFPGGGKGREGRHDIVFFEKNGLRHGEFALRHGTPGVGPSEAKERRWCYKVKEVCWSADSNILSVWIEEDAGDTGESHSCVLTSYPHSYAFSPTLDDRELSLVPFEILFPPSILLISN